MQEKMTKKPIIGAFGNVLPEPTKEDLEKLLEMGKQESKDPSTPTESTPLEGALEMQIGANITYQEKMEVYIAKILKKKGYRIASSSGKEISHTPEKWLGILCPEKTIQKKFLFFNVTKSLPADYIGKFTIESQAIFLEVYGREYIQKLMDITKEISISYKGKLHIQLKSEKPLLEEFNYPDF